MARKLFGFGIAVGVIVGIIISATGNTIAAICAGMFMTVLYITCIYIEELRKTDTDQQTQIDNLKRELEEMKRNK